MERQYITASDTLLGYDSLHAQQQAAPERHRREWKFSPNSAYHAYFLMHKGFVGESGGQELEDIATRLTDEWQPRYLNVAGWAAAEAALVQKNKPALHRVQLVDSAADCWQRALTSQEQISRSLDHAWLHEDSAAYRLALALAFAPLMKALVVGTVTDVTIERTFCDVAAIAQTSAVQRHLAERAGDARAVGDLTGFEHECNGLLPLLFMNDPRHLPLPAPARAGSGHEYRDQTHDIVVINQHWGDILKIVPIEIKGSASLSDLKRYKALIIRGKMHLSVPGKQRPEYTHGAFLAAYEGRATKEDQHIVKTVMATVQELLQLYQKGRRVEPLARSATRFHHTAQIAGTYPEFSLDRAKRR